jgi:aminomethyltransferase
MWQGDHVGLARVDGAGALPLLERACAQPLYLREGRARQTLLLREDAGIFADVIVGSADDGYYVLAEGPTEAELVRWLDRLREGLPAAKEASVRGLSGEMSVVGIDGPFAWEVLARVLGPGILGMPYLTLLRREEVLCLRAGKTGEYGYVLLVPRDTAGELRSNLADAAQQLGTALPMVGPVSLDVCALENWHFSIRNLVMPDPFGRAGDCRETLLARPLTPIELQLQWRVAYDKDYVGADALRARRAEGARARATCFTAEAPLSGGEGVLHAGDPVGEVLGARFSPTLGVWVGAALLATRFAHPHVALTATSATGPVPIATRTTPLLENLSLQVDPHKHSFATWAPLVPK